MYRQVIDPTGSPALSAALAALPLVTLLVLLGVARMKSHLAGLIGLGVAVTIAVGVYGMPLGQAADGALEGAVFGLFPIVWIILNAVWINKLQRASGHFEVIGRGFARLSGDVRVQAIVIAYCFGAMIESLSGFGTPIAVTAILLIALGIPPLKAAAMATFANTVPAAFGSLGNPIEALAKVTSMPAGDLAAMVGRQSAFVAMMVPFVLLLLVDGRRGLREAWPVAVVAGAGFGVGVFLVSNFFAYQLSDLGASVCATAAVVLLLRFWSPGGGLRPGSPVVASPATAGGPSPVAAAHDLIPSPPGAATAATVRDVATRPGPGNDPAAPADRHRDSRIEILRAFSPYILLTVLFAVTHLDGPVQRFVDDRALSFGWPGLHVVSPAGRPLKLVTFDFAWLGAAGTMLMLTGALTAVILRVPAKRALGCYWESFLQIRWAILTISCVLALAYVMNLAGMALSLGTWLAGLGGAFALLSGFLGWFGVALTGSDTSSNALFGAMQADAAKHIGLSPLLMAATNSTGGVLGKAVAMQNLTIAASAVGQSGKEGDILRKLIGWSLALLAVFCVFAWLQSTILSWMVP